MPSWPRSIFGNKPNVFYGMLAVVKARGGSGLPWHQDNQYTLVLGGAINIFAALCDITPDKAIRAGPMAVFPSLTMHKSGANTSAGPRKAFVIQYSAVGLRHAGTREFIPNEIPLARGGAAA